jgi:glycerophosphoryl diester phosphodiesterase
MALQPATRTRRRRWVLLLLAGVGALLTYRALAIRPMPEYAYLADKAPVILGHQGASAYAPSNTIESFKLALAQNADILELDVHKTVDGVIVVSHDEAIDRLTNGKGKIKEMTLAELRKFDFGYGFTTDECKSFPWRGKGVTISTLEDVFKTFPGRRVNIELKQVTPPEASDVWALVKQYQMEDKVLINAFPSEPVAAWRAVADDRVALGATKKDMILFAAFWLPHLDWLYQPSVPAFQIPVSEKVGPFTIHLDSPRLIARAHQLGIKVHYWTINDAPTMAHLIDIGADGIITDAPDIAYKVLKEKGLR